MAAYKFARSFKTPGGLTAYEYICRIRTSAPERFALNLIQQMPGANISDMTVPLFGDLQSQPGTQMQPGGGYMINADQSIRFSFLTALTWLPVSQNRGSAASGLHVSRSGWSICENPDE